MFDVIQWRLQTGHILLGCVPIQEFWKEMCKYLETAWQIKLAPSPWWWVLGYDPVIRLAPRCIKLLYKAMARSLLLQRWRTQLVPTIGEWVVKMKQVRNMERLRAFTCGGNRKFDKMWGQFMEEASGWRGWLFFLFGKMFCLGVHWALWNAVPCCCLVLDVLWNEMWFLYISILLVYEYHAWMFLSQIWISINI